jgi:hypothetical protein
MDEEEPSETQEILQEDFFKGEFLEEEFLEVEFCQPNQNNLINFELEPHLQRLLHFCNGFFNCAASIRVRL